MAASSGTGAAAQPKQGSLSKELVWRAIHRQMSGVRTCLQEGLQRTGVPVERFVVRFTISAKGTVSKARATDSNANDPVL